MTDLVTANNEYANLREQLYTKSNIEDLVAANKIKTTAVNRFEYNFDNQTLTVCYTGKAKEPTTVVYTCVDPKTYTNVVSAESLGKALNTEIRGKFATV
jgi:KTSC domain